MNICTQCPRKCKTDRKTNFGFCRQGELPIVAKYMLHFGEEPCISTEKGSGAIFFAGCNMRCPFCQNHKISQNNEKIGTEYTANELSDLFLKLQDMGAENINLVTPTHFSHHIAKALETAKLKIPVVYNCGGFESIETLKMLDGLVQIYLPDFKYFRRETAEKYCAAADYPEIAQKAILEMHRQTKQMVFDGEVLKKGLIVRHLVLPKMYIESIEIMRWLSENLDKNGFYISLMSQYVPCHKAHEYPEINRKVFTLEYEKVVTAASDFGLAGFIQERESATLDMTPQF